ncbi:hypothetical protein SAMN02745134_01671 [Clostridium acidisoli DSM 12555]|uniref:Uncharacterized protein n=1 Tax=Clostridium acidisoli DSM 12555 TaxID=1121291 RepID=A0A1W1XFS0_9CLOT|nr:cell division protein ZapB [Clostridium acidisoli]SMC22652.1 hypothetical protein SAMN02745134_01671 [Clostridium acidisoli DSM 12555]
MNNTHEWVYIDFIKNIWKFKLKENGNLVYEVMYDKCKWTKEKIVADHVIKYSIYIEEDIIHIIYANEGNELKYCTFKNKQWLGKLIYNIDDKFTIEDLKILIFNGKMHIFYLLKVNNANDHGILVDFIWSGEKIDIYTIENIILKEGIEDYFRTVSIDDKLEIYFITDQGDGLSLKISIYKDEKWTAANWLYNIQGNKIEFEVIKDLNGTNLINKSIEKNKYILEHVFINLSGNMKSYTIMDSKNEVIEPNLFNYDDALYSSWIEEGKIYYSKFKNDKWSSAKYLDIDASAKIKTCYSSIVDGEVYVNTIKIYCIMEPDFEILFMDKFIKNDEDDSNDEVNNKSGGEISDKFVEVSETNKKLEKEIDFINIQLEKKNRLIEEYEKGYKNKLSLKKNKMFLEIQQSIQKELDRINNQLIQEKAITRKLQDKLKENEEKNNILKKQVELLNEENKKLQEDLITEKNQTILRKILRRRSSDV